MGTMDRLKFFCGMPFWICRIVLILTVNLLLVGGIAGVVIALMNSSSNHALTSTPSMIRGTSSPSIAPTSGPGTLASTASTSTLVPRTSTLLQELESWIVRTDHDPLAFQDPSSPQSPALDWLATDTVALSEDRATTTTILQRYVLAVLYYATDGPHWMRQDLNFLATFATGTTTYRRSLEADLVVIANVTEYLQFDKSF